MIKAMQLRKSVRSYKNHSVSQTDLSKIKQFMREVKPLNSEIPMDIILFEEGDRFEETFKGISNSYAKVKAPHYLAFTSEKKSDYLENIGFVGEHLVLKMTELGIGTCWVGSPINQKTFNKLTKVKNNQSYIILIAFGYPANTLEMLTTRNRLKKETLVIGDIKDELNPILEALNIAPSAVNSQPWRVLSNGYTWDLYRSWKNILSKKFLNHLNRIDMGIGLNHIINAGEQFGYTVLLSNQNAAHFKNQKYVISVTFKKQ